MTTDQIMELCNQVRETAYAIHRYHGNGYMEKVYENALAHRLKKQGLDVRQQCPLTVYDEDGTVIGEHVAQLLNYLNGARKQHGLLINFGSRKFHVKKYVKTDCPYNYTRIIPALFFAFSAFFCG